MMLVVVHLILCVCLSNAISICGYCDAGRAFGTLSTAPYNVVSASNEPSRSSRGQNDATRGTFGALSTAPYSVVPAAGGSAMRHSHPIKSEIDDTSDRFAGHRRTPAEMRRLKEKHIWTVCGVHPYTREHHRVCKAHRRNQHRGPY